MPNICHNSVKLCGNNETVNKIKSISKNKFLSSLIDIRNLVAHETGNVEWKEDTVCFDTAWSPPYEDLIEISKSYPEIAFKLEYFIMEMMWCGCVSIKDGKEHNMIYYIPDRIGMSEEEIAYGKEIFREIMIN